jgi:hypothetical protein
VLQYFAANRKELLTYNGRRESDTYVCVCVYMYIYTCVCVYIYTYIYIHIHTQHIYTHTQHIHTHTHTRQYLMSVDTFGNARARVCVCTHMPTIYSYRKPSVNFTYHSSATYVSHDLPITIKHRRLIPNVSTDIKYCRLLSITVLYWRLVVITFD